MTSEYLGIRGAWRACSPMKKARTQPPPIFPLEDLPDELLVLILSKVPRGDLLLRVSCTSRRLAGVSDAVFQDVCASRRWRPPRHPRGSEAGTKFYKWRSVYFMKACRGCGDIGDFPVRKSHDGPVLFIMCGECIFNKNIQERLRRDVTGGVYFDRIGYSGEQLVKEKPNRKKRKQRGNRGGRGGN